MIFEGVFAAIVCPMNDNGMIDEKSLASHVSRIAKIPGMSGILCNGHAGENHVLNFDEKKSVIEICRKASPETKIIAGLNSEGKEGLTKEARDAELSGADAVMVFPPFSWALGHDINMALSYHKVVLESSSLPVFIYQASIKSGGCGITKKRSKNFLLSLVLPVLKKGVGNFAPMKKR
nr:dihydrodipicolinate synthase family protein [Halomonas socia]